MCLEVLPKLLGGNSAPRGQQVAARMQTSFIGLQAGWQGSPGTRSHASLMK